MDQRCCDDRRFCLMIFLRVLVLALLTGVAVCALTWVITRERRWLRLAWRLLIGGLFAALIFFAVLFVERLAATPVQPGSGALPAAQMSIPVRPPGRHA